MQTVIQQWMEGLKRAASVPELRFDLAQKLRHTPSPLADIVESRVFTARTLSDNLIEATLATIADRPGHVLIIDEVHVDYENPTNSSAIDGRYVGLVLGDDIPTHFPKRTLENWLTDFFGALRPHLVVPRDKAATLRINPGSSDATPETAACNVITRMVARYEPKWLCELLGLVNPTGPLDAAPAIGRA